jgi:BirA family transcriptional regulator, biotin operon repressor / biotin---[acetyl-CoA-carboxylase] ligase
MTTDLTTIAVHLLAEHPSTNDLAAREALTSNAAHGTAWVADVQTAGRGRRDTDGLRRSWFSPAGKNVLMSVLLRPNVEPARASALTLVTAVAAAQTLRKASGLAIGIKWPNDLYIGDLKLAGILTEASTSARGLDSVIVGLGLNVNIEAEEIPEDLEAIMTSLKIASGHAFDRLNLVLALRQAIVSACDRFCREGLEVFLPDLRALDVTAGRRVTLLKGGQPRTGTALSIGSQGQLLVELDDSTQTEVLAGEVRFF